ncbi:MAG: RNA polymerase sigma factor [Gemmatimonadota bacterium]|nr:RNA polymerase sigma factor [Gemmatimonadota bacterium]
MLDDRSAVEQARQGDERAWKALYDRTADLAFRLAFGVVGDRDAALDVVQEAYINAARSIDRFRGDSSFRGWIASIAVNEARSWLRKRGRERRVSLDSVAEPRAGGRGPDERVGDAQLAGRALEVVATLPDRQRDAVLLRTTEGLSYREIAERIGSTEGSVRVSYHLGIKKVREQLSGLDPATGAGSSGEEDRARGG